MAEENAVLADAMNLIEAELEAEPSSGAAAWYRRPALTFWLFVKS